MKTFRSVLVALALLCAPVVASAQMTVQAVAVTTDGSGNATVYSPQTFGVVVAVRYVPASASPLASSATLTITDNATGLQVLAVSTLGSLSRDFWPRAFTMNTTGTAATYDGTRAVLDLVPVAGALKVVVASGGATTSGTVYIYVQGR